MPAAAGMDLTTLFTRADADPLPLAVLVVATGWYLWSARRVRARGGEWPWWRSGSFLLAVALAAVALLSGLGLYSRTDFLDHALQDMGLAVLVPAFFVLSAPVTLLLRSGPPKVADAVSRLVHGPAGRVLSHPAVGLPLYGGALIGFYFSGLYADSLTDPVVHGLVQLGLPVVACLFFWPLADVDPLPRRRGFGIRILMLLLALPVYGIVGMALESQSRPMPHGGTLADLHTGAAWLWVVGDAVCLIGAIAVFCQWLGADERRAQHGEQLGGEAAERQLALWRASREAAARAASG